MRSNKRAAVLIGISTLSFSTAPVIISQLHALNPFLLGACWRAGLAIGCAFYLTIQHRHHFTGPGNARRITRQLTSPHLFLSCIGFHDYALLALAATQTTMAIAATVYNLYTILSVCLLALLFRNSARYQPITPATLLLLIAAFIGTAIVISAQHGRLTNPHAPAAMTALGLLTVIAAPTVGSLSFATLRWGFDAAQALESSNAELPCTVLATLIAAVVTIPVQLIIATTIAGAAIPTPPQQAGIALLAGMIVNPISSITLRAGNLMANNLAVNAVTYAAPLLTITWLHLLGMIQVPRPDYLMAGALIIAGSNLALTLESHVRVPGALLIMLVATCTAAPAIL